MARNCEKKLVGLNRLWLEKQRKDELEKRPKRPHLSSLNSASEVKKWIPGIKREIDYCLDQISGARQHRYPDTKMKEFERKVEELEKEYKRFVKKVYELDPSTTGIPWQPRGYTSKRKNMESYSAETIPKKICTPLIDEEHHGRTSSPANSSKSIVDLTDDTNSLQASNRDKGPDLKSGSDNVELITSKGADAKSGCVLNDMKLVQLKSLVGLEYDSSSDSDIS